MSSTTTTTSSSVGWAFKQCRDIFKEPTDPEMREYLCSKRELFQNQVVNVDQGMSLGPALYLWTHRLTSIDVVSIVTTTTAHPIKDSPTMMVTPDINNTNVDWGIGGKEETSSSKLSRANHQKAHPPISGSFERRLGGPSPYIDEIGFGASGKWKIAPDERVDGGSLAAIKGSKAKTERKKLLEKKRLRSPMYPSVFTSPLEAIAAGTRKDHERIGKCLVAERKRFMGLLEKERRERKHIEVFACDLIKATYRGHCVRKGWEEIVARQHVRLRVRKNLREILKAKKAPFALGRLEKQQTEERRRCGAAKSIQASFRCFLARKTVEKRRHAAFLLRRRRAARTLQCWTRLIFAGRRLRYDQTRAFADLNAKSALKIQTQYRRRLGARITAYRRRVAHSIAATMIQGQWRLHETMQCTREMTRLRLFQSAAVIQRIVRGYVARQKVARCLAKVRARKRTRAACTLQGLIRTAQLSDLSTAKIHPQWND